ncbi:MAG: TIR domain-containing protein [Candidatus Kentron sp. G]|nr:MAG: TIR domain-containing protein [Candidatus Kentron sp. G]
MHGYDLFLSHRGENKPWVETLARNLTDCGYRVFLDDWEIIPGNSLAGQLAAALEASRAGVLVATPESLESGWVQEEYERMLALRARTRTSPGPGLGEHRFRILPLVFGERPDFPFLENLLCIDCSDHTPGGYRRAFYRLLCAIEGKAPGDMAGKAPPLPIDPQIPEPMTPDLSAMAPQPLAAGEEQFLEEVFDTLFHGQPVLLLAQAGRDRLGIHQAILSRAWATRRFGEGNSFHLVPPGDPDISSADYLAFMARQAGLRWEDITGSFSLQVALEERLHRGPLFLLITRLASGSPAGRQALAGLLRSLLDKEEFQQNLGLVLCGSGELAELKFAAGAHSLLTNAEDLYWPEPTVEDLCRWQAGCYVLRNSRDIVP